MVRQRAHRSEGLRGPSSGSTRDKTKIDFFEPEIWAIPTCAHRSRARIDPFTFNSIAAWERKRIRFNGDISTVRFISTAGHRILSVFISTTEHEVTRAFRNANRARVTSQLFCPEGGLHSCLFFLFFLFVFVMFVYQAKIIRNCFYHKPQKNSTTALTPPASNHYSIFADPPLIIHTNYCLLFPPALGSAPFPFLFPFLPQIRTLRQVANNCTDISTRHWRHIFMQSYIYIMRTSMATCSDYIIFNAVTSTSGHQWSLVPTLYF